MITTFTNHTRTKIIATLLHEENGKINIHTFYNEDKAAIERWIRKKHVQLYSSMIIRFINQRKMAYKIMRVDRPEMRQLEAHFCGIQFEKFDQVVDKIWRHRDLLMSVLPAKDSTQGAWNESISHLIEVCHEHNESIQRSKRSEASRPAEVPPKDGHYTEM